MALPTRTKVIQSNKKLLIRNCWNHSIFIWYIRKDKMAPFYIFKDTLLSLDYNASLFLRIKTVWEIAAINEIKNGKNANVATLHWGFPLQYSGKILEPFIIKPTMIQPRYEAARTYKVIVEIISNSVWNVLILKHDKAM